MVHFNLWLLQLLESILGLRAFIVMHEHLSCMPDKVAKNHNQAQSMRYTSIPPYLNNMQLLQTGAQP